MLAEIRSKGTDKLRVLCYHDAIVWSLNINFIRPYMQDEQWIANILEDLRGRDLGRKLRLMPQSGAWIDVNGRRLINLAQNDYLNLAHRPSVIEAARRALSETNSTSSSASRLVTGTLRWHSELEERLAAFLGYPRAIVYGSGYLANLGVITALVHRNDVVVADKHVHASLIDGISLSGAKLLRFLHNDISHLERVLVKARNIAGSGGKVLLVTESVFSMDGDVAPLVEMSRLAEKFGAIFVVDEAHAIGVFGENGRGLVNQLELQGKVDICTGSFCKSLGSYGGFVAGSRLVAELLINVSRPFIFNTSLPPAVVAASSEAISVLEREPQLGAELLAIADSFRGVLHDGGLDTGSSCSQIVPLIVGENCAAMSLSRILEDEGVFAVAIREPTVPRGTARLRFSLSLAYHQQKISAVADVVLKCARRANIT